MSKYSVTEVAKPSYKKGLKTSKLEFEAEINSGNKITGFKIQFKGKRKLITVSKGKLLKAWKEVKNFVG